LFFLTASYCGQFYWIDGWITVNQILVRLPKIGGRRNPECTDSKLDKSDMSQEGLNTVFDKQTAGYEAQQQKLSPAHDELYF